MSEDDKDYDPQRPARIAQTLEDIARTMGEGQRFYADHAQEYGYSKELLGKTASRYLVAPDHPSFAAIENSFGNFRVFMDAKVAELKGQPMYDPSSMTVAMTGTSVALAGTISQLDLSGFIQTASSAPPLWSKERSDKLAAKLAELHPELGRHARSLWQTQYSGIESAVRESLFLVRQIFDHLFELVAPEHAVRQSPSFKQRNADDPQQVTRMDRLRYASTLIPDRTRAEYLLSEARQMIDLYQQLNRLHTRESIDLKKAEASLIAMRGWIEAWVDALP